MSRDIHAYKFRIPITQIRAAVAKTALLAAAIGCSALALAPPAAAAKLNKHLAVDCPQPYSQTCSPKQGLSVTTAGPLYAVFTADGNPPSCAPGVAAIFFGDKMVNRTQLEPGQTLAAGRDLAPGTYQVDVQMSGVLGGCNTGSMSGWSGTLSVETDDDAVRDQPWLEPPIRPAPPH